ncbi:hypothetical protein ASPTUDRAFT_189550 [Aspergillus tubingensis CBS 134.48]|uniref:Uncharacterized protein n=1 Tax=Aspergillus tubingensis (strain CBS 134.48) TaxID=767770 RepID=A0A1L9N862_ASPTC|nr:hypothetical protein ASPTUDRAFT_189550 [Aspergillus tubingensis CBS 134.48]
MAQTAAGVWPQTKTNLGVSFGDNIITPGAWINPNDTTYPTVYPGYSTSSYPGTYMLMMVDYDVADSAFATLDQYSSLVPGRLVNTTTRLHWWGWNYTLQDGKFINSSNALASYHPAQPVTSRVHDFTLFLFDQPQDYAPPQDVTDHPGHPAVEHSPVVARWLLLLKLSVIHWLQRIFGVRRLVCRITAQRHTRTPGRRFEDNNDKESSSNCDYEISLSVIQHAMGRVTEGSTYNP